jgi:stearoyl-CoA desaturase (delta-9 desaturase)
LNLGNQASASHVESDQGNSQNDSSQNKVGDRQIPILPSTSRSAWVDIVAVVTLHLLSLLVFLPWLFSWTGLVLFILGIHVYGVLGITIGYHRLLTHKGFTCSKWFEHLLALIGVCHLQYAPLRWVSTHRRHHQHSDHTADPHSPVQRGFGWSHIGWLLVDQPALVSAASYDRYARDLLRDPFYLFLERHWLWLYAAHVLLYFSAGLGLGWWVTGTAVGGLQMATSVVVWGVFLRIVIGWHAAWSVNSLAHTRGYRTYNTDDDSRNNWFVSLITGGEGWHNNHHADQRSAVHGHQWWEYDLSYWVIRVLEFVGLVHNVVRPRVWSESRVEDDHSV